MNANEANKGCGSEAPSRDRSVTEGRLSYASADGASTVQARVWALAELADASAAMPLGIVQIVHGMSEHIGRYDAFARNLAEQGFVVCGNDHIGHGQTAARPEDLGHIPLAAGKDALIADVHELRRLMERGAWREAVADGDAAPEPSSASRAASAEVRDSTASREAPAASSSEPPVAGASDVTASSTPPAARIPYFLFGHSMGSFIVRAYLDRPFASGLAGAILSGTGEQPRALSAAGRALSRLLARLRGERYCSSFIDGLGAGAYAKRIDGARTPFDWLSTDSQVVRAYLDDPLCGTMFTVAGYAALTDLTGEIADPACVARVPHDLPLLFIAGSDDPVGECGKGVHAAVEALRRAGVREVDEIIYPGMRHEVLNEPGGAQVRDDVVAWLRAHL